MSGALPPPAQRPNGSHQTRCRRRDPTRSTRLLGRQQRFSIPPTPVIPLTVSKYAPDANNVYVVKVLVLIPGSNWEITLKNNAAAARTFACVVAGSLADSRQPWIDILPMPLPPGATNYDALPGQRPPTPRDAVGCQLRDWTADHHQNRLGTAIGGANFTINSVTTPINPNETKDLKVAFNPPTTIGVTNTTYLLNSNDNLALTTAGVPANRSEQHIHPQAGGDSPGGCLGQHGLQARWRLRRPSSERCTLGKAKALGQTVSRSARDPGGWPGPLRESACFRISPLGLSRLPARAAPIFRPARTSWRQRSPPRKTG